jgi:hypothetical protein
LLNAILAQLAPGDYVMYVQVRFGADRWRSGESRVQS